LFRTAIVSRQGKGKGGKSAELRPVLCRFQKKGALFRGKSSSKKKKKKSRGGDEILLLGVCAPAVLLGGGEAISPPTEGRKGGLDSSVVTTGLDPQPERGRLDEKPSQRRAVLEALAFEKGGGGGGKT